jgi:hypothetical protein
MPTDIRIVASFRTSPASWFHILSMARKAGVSRSEMTRKLLAIGVQHAPREWRP